MEEQQDLITAEMMPADDRLVEAVRRGDHSKPVVTGKILSRDIERVRSIVSDLISGLSQRQVAMRHNVGRNSLRQCVEVLEERGELEPLKQRLSRKFARVAELSADNLIEALEDNKVPSNVLPIVAGVAVDKTLLLSGEATSISERREVSVDAFRERVEAMRQARRSDPPAIPIDSVSSD